MTPPFPARALSDLGWARQVLNINLSIPSPSSFLSPSLLCITATPLLQPFTLVVRNRNHVWHLRLSSVRSHASPPAPLFAANMDPLRARCLDDEFLEGHTRRGHWEEPRHQLMP